MMVRRRTIWCVLFLVTTTSHALSTSSLQGIAKAKSTNTKEVSRRTALVGILGSAAALATSSSSSSRNQQTPRVDTITTTESLEEFTTMQQMDEQRNNKVDENNDDGALVSLIAGSALTASSTLVRYPLDTATVRLQMPNAVLGQDIFKDCWKGVWTPLLANIPAGAVFFSIKDTTTHFLVSDGGMTLTLATMISVAIAQVPNWIVRNPSEVYKTQQQAGTVDIGNNNKGMLRVATSFEDMSNAIKHYYQGFWMNIAYNYPADIIKFLVYDYLLQAAASFSSTTLEPWHGAVAGALATIVAQVMTTPLDVVRNRAMALSQEEEEDESYTEALLQLGRDRSLFCGAPTRIGKGMVSGAVQFAAYEQTKLMVSECLANMHHMM